MRIFRDNRREIALALLALAGDGRSPELEREMRIRKIADSPPFAPLPPKVSQQRAKGYAVVPDRLMRKSRRSR